MIECETNAKFDPGAQVSPAVEDVGRRHDGPNTVSG
jgi:hypothetical protein